MSSQTVGTGSQLLPVGVKNKSNPWAAVSERWGWGCESGWAAEVSLCGVTSMPSGSCSGTGVGILGQLGGFEGGVTAPRGSRQGGEVLSL